MANEQNLRPYKKGEQSPEELKKKQRNGGIKSGIVRREKKLLKEVAAEKLLKLMPCGKTFQDLSIDILIDKVTTGEIKAVDVVKVLEFLRDTAGQKPVEKQEIINPNPIEVKVDKSDIKAAIINIDKLADE